MLDAVLCRRRINGHAAHRVLGRRRYVAGWSLLSGLMRVPVLMVPVLMVVVLVPVVGAAMRPAFHRSLRPLRILCMALR